MRLNEHALLALALGFTYGTLAAKALRTGDTTQGVLLLLAGITLAIGLWGASDRGASIRCTSAERERPDQSW